MGNHYIGLMSGTSLDGIDVAIADFEQSPPQLIHCYYHCYPQSLKTALGQLCTPSANSSEIDQMGQMDVRLGEEFAHAVTIALKQAGLNAKDIRAVGSHGQTIRHRPDFTHRFTLQIADPNVIAEYTGITTVADFRRKDMACGGEGAPLVPAFHEILFAENHPNCTVLNIGGIANITILEDQHVVRGFDTGPGNGLMDYWTQQTFNTAFDQQGQLASKGSVNHALLKSFLADPYFSKLPPKSTGREYFHHHWLNTHLEQHPGLNPYDILATLNALTATTICDAIDHYAPMSQTVIVCGGGVYNLQLLSHIKQRLKNQIVTDCQQACGIDADWVEAMAFAWLAKQCLEQRPGNVPQVTGAKKACILGAIYWS